MVNLYIFFSDFSQKVGEWVDCYFHDQYGEFLTMRIFVSYAGLWCKGLPKIMIIVMCDFVSFYTECLKSFKNK